MSKLAVMKKEKKEKKEPQSMPSQASVDLHSASPHSQLHLSRRSHQYCCLLCISSLFTFGFWSCIWDSTWSSHNSDLICRRSLGRLQDLHVRLPAKPLLQEPRPAKLPESSAQIFDFIIPPLISTHFTGPAIHRRLQPSWHPCSRRP